MGFLSKLHKKHKKGVSGALKGGLPGGKGDPLGRRILGGSSGGGGGPGAAPGPKDGVVRARTAISSPGAGLHGPNMRHMATGGGMPPQRSVPTKPMQVGGPTPMPKQPMRTGGGMPPQRAGMPTKPMQVGGGAGPGAPVPGSRPGMQTPANRPPIMRAEGGAVSRKGTSKLSTKK